MFITVVLNIGRMRLASDSRAVFVRRGRRAHLASGRPCRAGCGRPARWRTPSIRACPRARPQALVRISDVRAERRQHPRHHVPGCPPSRPRAHRDRRHRDEPCGRPGSSLARRYVRSAPPTIVGTTSLIVAPGTVALIVRRSSRRRRTASNTRWADRTAPARAWNPRRRWPGWCARSAGVAGAQLRD